MVGYFIFRIYKMRLHLRSLKDVIYFNGTADNEQLNELGTQLHHTWSMSPNILLVILLISLFMGLIMVGYFLFRICKMRSHLRSLKDLKNYFNGTADNEQLNELRTQLKKSNFPIRYTKILTKTWTIPARGVPVTPNRYQEDKPPTPPARPSTSKVEVILMQELPSNKSLEYAVNKLENKGLMSKDTEPSSRSICIQGILLKSDLYLSSSWTYLELLTKIFSKCLGELCYLEHMLPTCIWASGSLNNMTDL